MKYKALHKLSFAMSAFDVRFEDAADAELVRAHENRGYKARKMPKLNTDHIRVFTQIATASGIEEIEVRYLTEMLNFKQTTMHRAIKALEMVDFVVSGPSARDHRSFVVRLTEQGKAFAHMLDTLIAIPVDDEKGGAIIAEEQQTHDELKATVEKEIAIKAAADALVATGNVGQVKVETTSNSVNISPKLRRPKKDGFVRMAIPVPAAHTELKEHLEKRFGTPFQVGRNYIKSTVLNDNPDDYAKRILRTISMPVVFRRLGVTNVIAMSERLMAMSDEDVLATLRPNVKYRDVSDNALEELQSMIAHYPTEAIEQNPSLQRRFSQLSAQVAREARAKERRTRGIGPYRHKD